MAEDFHDKYKDQALDLITKSGFPLLDKEIESMKANDFGLGNFEKEGFFLVDLLRTDRVRTNLIILLPGQILPEHLHPSYDNEQGKEETIRVLYGESSVFVEGKETNPELKLPQGKSDFYTARHEVKLKTGEQYSVPPNTKHWFMGGPQGSVNMAVQNRVNEDRNVYYDPESDGCKISNDNLS